MNDDKELLTVEDLKLKEMYCKINISTLQIILDPVFNCIFSRLNSRCFQDYAPC